jgi:hypothetical protein
MDEVIEIPIGESGVPLGEYPMLSPQPRHAMAAARLTRCPQRLQGFLLAMVLT